MLTKVFWFDSEFQAAAEKGRKLKITFCVASDRAAKKV